MNIPGCDSAAARRHDAQSLKGWQEVVGSHRASRTLKRAPIMLRITMANRETTTQLHAFIADTTGFMVADISSRFL